MKFGRTFVSGFLLGLIFVFAIPYSASARVVTLEKGTYIVAKDEVIDDDLFVGAQMVEIYGTVNGDVYAGAETLRVNGVINGDLHAGAGSVYLSGRISQDVYLGAGNVTVNSAQIGDSFLVGAGNVTIDPGTTIGGSLLVGTGNLSVYSPVARNLFVGAGNADINTTVGGEVRLAAGSVSLGPDTRIDGDLYYAVGDDTRQISISSSATVAGQVKRISVPTPPQQDMQMVKKNFTAALAAVSLALNVISFLGALLVGLLGLRLAKKPFVSAADMVTKSFFPSTGVGLLTSIVIFPLLFLLVITGVGIPLAGILFLMFLLTAYLTKIVVGLALGNWLAQKLNWKSPSPYLVFSLGLLVIYLFKIIPPLGFLSSLVVFWVGLGALTRLYRQQLSL